MFMIRKIFLKGLITAIPMVIFTQFFFYITGINEISIRMLSFIKIFLYFCFVLSAIGLPIYLSLSSLSKYNSLYPILTCISIIMISWVIFTFIVTFSAFTIYRGLAHDIELKFNNMIIYYLRIYFWGIILTSVICVPIVIIISRFFNRIKLAQ
jgi:hypothetical protein